MERISLVRWRLGLVLMFDWIRCRMLRSLLRHHLLDDIWNMIHSVPILRMKFREKNLAVSTRIGFVFSSFFVSFFFSFIFHFRLSPPHVEPIAFFLFLSNNQPIFFLFSFLFSSHVEPSHFLFSLSNDQPIFSPSRIFFFTRQTTSTNFASIMIWYDTDDYNFEKIDFFCIIIFCFSWTSFFLLFFILFICIALSRLPTHTYIYNSFAYTIHRTW